MNKKIYLAIIVLVLLAGIACADEVSDFIRMRDKVEKDARILEKAIAKVKDPAQKANFLLMYNKHISLLKSLPTQIQVKGQTVTVKSEVVNEIDANLQAQVGPKKPIPAKPEAGKINVWYDEQGYWINFAPTQPYYGVKYLDDNVRGSNKEMQDSTNVYVHKVGDNLILGISYIANERPTKTTEPLTMFYSWDVPDCMIIDKEKSGDLEGDAGQILETKFSIGSCTKDIFYDIKLRLTYDEAAGIGKWIYDANDPLIEITWRVSFKDLQTKLNEDFDKLIEDGLAYVDNGMLAKAQGIETELRKYYEDGAAIKMTNEQMDKYEDFREKLVEGYVYDVNKLYSEGEEFGGAIIYGEIERNNHKEWCIITDMPCKKLIEDLDKRKANVAGGKAILDVKVTDNTGKPLEGVKVALFEKDGATPRNLEKTTTAQGVFDAPIADVPAGVSVIKFTKDAYEPIEKAIELKAGDSKQINAVLVPTKLKKGKITIQVYVEGKAATEQIELEIKDKDGKDLPPEPQTGYNPQKDKTDLTGRLEISMLNAGTIVIMPANKDKYEDEQFTAVVEEATPSVFALRLKAKEDRKGNIIVKVIDEESKKSVKNVAVKVFKGGVAVDNAIPDKTNENGVAQTKGKVEMGEYVLKVDAGEYELQGAPAANVKYLEAQSESVVVDAENAEVVMALKQVPKETGDLNIIVTVDGLAPRDNIKLKFIDTNGAEQEVLTNQNGISKLTDLAPGWSKVQLTDPRYAKTAVKSVQIVKGQTAQVELNIVKVRLMDGTAQIEGRVVSSSDIIKIANIDLYIKYPSGETHSERIDLDDGGYFSADVTQAGKIMLGQYEWIISASAHAGAKGALTIESAGKKPIPTITLPAIGSGELITNHERAQIKEWQNLADGQYSAYLSIVANLVTATNLLADDTKKNLDAIQTNLNKMQNGMAVLRAISTMRRVTKQNVATMADFNAVKLEFETKKNTFNRAVEEFNR